MRRSEVTPTRSGTGTGGYASDAVSSAKWAENIT